jgi:hypothetical protein
MEIAVVNPQAVLQVSGEACRVHGALALAWHVTLQLCRCELLLLTSCYVICYVLRKVLWLMVFYTKLCNWIVRA